MPLTQDHIRMQDEVSARRAATVRRILPGKIKREAPPGPTMTEAEFKDAMDNLAIDAARWRWLRRNWSALLDSDTALLGTGGQLEEIVDRYRGAIQKSR
jgi:hypothetical protein